MRVNDAIVGVVLVVFSLMVITYSTTFPTLHGQAYGPSLFPILIGSCLATCGLLLIIRGLLVQRFVTSDKPTRTDGGTGTKSDNWIQWGDWVNDRSRRINMLLVPSLLIIYILLSDFIGFIPLSVLMLGVMLYRLGSSPFLSLLIAVLTTGLLQLLFAKVLLVPLPAGLLLPLLG